MTLRYTLFLNLPEDKHLHDSGCRFFSINVFGLHLISILDLDHMLRLEHEQNDEMKISFSDEK